MCRFLMLCFSVCYLFFWAAVSALWAFLPSRLGSFYCTLLFYMLLILSVSSNKIYKKYTTTTQTASLNATSLPTKQGIALTGRNTTGPPSRAVPWWVALHSGVLQTTTDDDRRQRPSLVCFPTLYVGKLVITLRALSCNCTAATFLLGRS